MTSILLLAWSIVAALVAVLHYVASEPVPAAVWFLTATVAYGFWEVVRVLNQEYVRERRR